jgi:hypothetical protein
MDTFYRERANGKWEYWAYSDGRRVYINSAWAEQAINRKTAKLITVK